MKEKFLETSRSVLPIVIVVLIMNFSLSPVPFSMIISFLLGSVAIIVGLAVFLMGIDLSISKIGSLVGNFTANLDSIAKILLCGTFLGFIISVAEPDLLILANEIKDAIGLNVQLIVMIISLGVGIMVSIGLLRIIKEISMPKLFLSIYIIIFILMALSDDLGHAIAFDSSGATTGAMTTPFIISMCIATSALKGSDESEDNSFGLVGVASTGPILAALVMRIVLKGSEDVHVSHETINFIIKSIKDATFAIVPITIVFIIMNKLYLKSSQTKKILIGIVYTYIGLIIFLAGVYGGFMQLARTMGDMLSGSKILPVVGFILGLVVVLAEPAVYVLSKQVEDVTGGSIPAKRIMISLSIGVAFAVMLSMMRILNENLKLFMIIVPGFLLAIILSFRIPKIFVGVAFDSGGVASGPMTATFILALCQGASNTPADGFGVISLVAMIPVLTVMILGLLYKEAIK